MAVDVPQFLQSSGTFIAAVVAAGATIYNLRRNSKRQDAADKKAQAILDVAAATKEAAEETAELAKKNNIAIVETKDGVFEVGNRVDGRLSELLKSARAEGEANTKAARAEGRAEGEQAQRDRSAPSDQESKT